MYGFIPLEIGFIISAFFLFFQDMRMRRVRVASYAPALIGTGLFYAPTLPPLYYVGFIALLGAATLGTTYGVLWFFTAKVGIGDYVTIAVFSVWPQLAIVALALALAVGIIGHKQKMWNRGLRAIPLAGLMGFCAMLFIVVSVLNSPH